MSTPATERQTYRVAAAMTKTKPRTQDATTSGNTVYISTLAGGVWK
jgi:hypothetical protein